MSEQEKHEPELTAFAAELAALRPNAGSLNGERHDVAGLMFAAGRAAALDEARGRARHVWPAAFAAMSCAAAVLLVMLVNRPQPQVVERIVRVEVPAAKQAGSGTQNSPEFGFLAALIKDGKRSVKPAAGDNSLAFYRELRERILADGLDALSDRSPAKDSPAGERISRDELLKELLGRNNKS